jgi:hypothetical protein
VRGATNLRKMTVQENIYVQKSLGGTPKEDKEKS